MFVEARWMGFQAVPLGRSAFEIENLSNQFYISIKLQRIFTYKTFFYDKISNRTNQLWIMQMSGESTSPVFDTEGFYQIPKTELEKAIIPDYRQDKRRESRDPRAKWPIQLSFTYYIDTVFD